MFVHRFVRLITGFLVFAVLIVAADDVFADEGRQPYDSSFLGISYHYSSFFDSDGDGFVERFPPRTAGGTFTYGFPGFRWARPRAGLGWKPDRPLYVSAGVEIPLYERLNVAQGRGFGIFLLSDLIFGFPNEPSVGVDTKLVGLIPVTLFGGVSLGGGVTHSGEPLVHIGYKTGVFPID